MKTPIFFKLLTVLCLMWGITTQGAGIAAPTANQTSAAGTQSPQTNDLLRSKAAAPIYYIDFEYGDDTQDGISPATAWKHIPGTRPATDYDNGWQATQWGTPVVIDSSHKVLPGTIFRIKQGSAHTYANGGGIWLDRTYYSDSASANSPITFELDQNWGTGNVIFDGTDMEIGVALILIKIDGVAIDGKTAPNFIIRNSSHSGIQVKEKNDGSPVHDVAFRNLTFFNNGTAYEDDTAGAGDGQLNIRHAIGLIVDQCIFDGDNNFVNGLIAGDNHKSVSQAQVTNCIAYNHHGETVGNDAGIGFKAFNSQITFENIDSHHNLKGFDLGEQAGDNQDITYQVINSLAHDNFWGINLTGPGNAYTGKIRFYVINNLVYDNQGFAGSNIYASPFDLYMVHNVYANNGSGENSGNLNVNPTPDNTSPINVHIYNNIFFKPHTVGRRGWNVTSLYWEEGISQLNWYSDYNAYIQGEETYFARWGFWGYSGCYRDYSYGPNGPGHASGDWYDDYGCDTSLPSNSALGHHHADAHSKGTGADDPTAPPFADQPNHDYQLTTAYRGTDLSTMSWYIPEMGIDRNGTPRTSWDIGAYEFASDLVLHGTPGDRTIYLAWEFTSSQSPTSWMLHYDGPQGDQPPTITDIPAPTSTYTLTGLTNNTPYTITLTTVGVSPVLSDTVQVTPVATDNQCYLPLIRR